ncbi:MAG: hypothetical protein QXF30_05040 [Thermoplasmata archaeon]
MYVDEDIFQSFWASYKVEFDTLDNESGAADKYEEEDVYHIEGPIQSGSGVEKYYRLYHHDAENNGLPRVIKTTLSDELKTEELEEGHHMIRIIVSDFNNNRKTGDFHIYIRKGNLVDYSRGVK